MATKNRQPDSTVTMQDAIWREPWRMEFYHALRQLEACVVNKPGIGASIHTWEDVVRLRQEPFAGFAPATIAKFQPGQGEELPWLSSYFLGLLGPNGPLPLHLTEYAIERIKHHDDETFARFLDIFNNRVLSLFYRARAEAEPTLQIGHEKSDHFSRYMASLAGLGLPQLLERDAFPDTGKLFFAGRLSSTGRNPEGLAAILNGLFGHHVEIEEFVGGWLTISLQEQYRLGSTGWQLGCPVARNSSDGESSAAETGRIPVSNKPGAVVGSHVWDCQHTFTIVMGPVAFAEAKSLLPGRDKLRVLSDIVRNYCGDFLRWKLKLVILRNKIPETRLGRNAELGWTTWITSRPMEQDPDDLVLDPQIVAVG